VLYLFLKTIHILSVIIALGANLTYGFLLYRAEKEPIHILFMLKTIQWIDRNIANRFYIIVLITGLWMVWINNYQFSLLWIWLSLTLFIAVALMGITLYAPVIKKQILLAEQNQIDTDAYRRINRRSKQLGIIVTILVIAILVLMIVKPTVII
jgi:uncharacterized membrane protein